MWEVTDYHDNYLARPGFFGFPNVRDIIRLLLIRVLDFYLYFYFLHLSGSAPLPPTDSSVPLTSTSHLTRTWQGNSDA